MNEIKLRQYKKGPLFFFSFLIVLFTSTTCDNMFMIDLLPDGLSGNVSIIGEYRIGRTLTIDPTGIKGGSGGLSFQWLSDGANISGANDISYVIKNADVGKVISCVITRGDSPDRFIANGQRVPYTIIVQPEHRETGDSVTAVPDTGHAGNEIVLHYTVGNTAHYNMLRFSGVASSIADVTTEGSGTRRYTVDPADAWDGIITITAIFEHTDLIPDPISFTRAGRHFNITYGDNTYGDNANEFANAITLAHSGTGAVTYSSSDTSVATVNASGVVTILRASDALVRITAEKAPCENYNSANDYYTLTVDPRPITITPDTGQTKVFDTADPVFTYTSSEPLIAGNSFSGALSRAIGENVGTYLVTLGTLGTIDTLDPLNTEGNYSLELVDVTFEITQAEGALVTKPVGTPTTTGIDVSGVSLQTPTGQTIQYAISQINNEAASDLAWQYGTSFSGLSAGTVYYIYARSAENNNYMTGVYNVSDPITTGRFTLSAAHFNFSGNTIRTYNASGQTVTVLYTGTGINNITAGAITVSYTGIGGTTYVASTTAPVNAGTYNITVTTSGGTDYDAVTTPMTLGTLTINPKPLTVSGATHTRQYDSTTSTTGITVTLGGIETADTANVSPDVITAEYIYPTAGTTTVNITGVTLSGTAAANYIVTVPVHVTVVGITQATGALVTKPLGTPTTSGIDVSGVTLQTPTGQQIQYAISLINNEAASSLAWQYGTSFNGLSAGTVYYIYARSAGNNNFMTGVYNVSDPITTGTFILSASHFNFSGNTTRTYNASGQIVTVNYTGTGINNITAGAITVYYDGSTTPPANVGTYNITVTTSGGTDYSAIASPLLLGTLTINPKPLTVSGVIHTRQYNGTNGTNGTTAATFNATDLSNITFNGIESGDTVAATSITAAYTNANAGTTSLNITALTVNNSNYIVTVPVTFIVSGGITRATGAAVTTPTSTNTTINSITASSTLVNATGQTIEYAISTSNTATGLVWQSSTLFSGLSAGTTYFIYARSAENVNFLTGMQNVSAAITTGLSTLTAAHFNFSGNAIRIYNASGQIVPVNYTGVITTTTAGNITVHYTGTGGTTYPISTTPPVNAGTYNITVTTSGGTEYSAITTPLPLGTLTINPKPLIVIGATHTKPFDGTPSTTGITISLSGIETVDAANVSPNTITAGYMSTVAGTTTVNITAVTLSGSAAANYTVTVPVLVSVVGITRITGAAVSGSPSALSVQATSSTTGSLTVLSVNIPTNPGNQFVEYAIHTTNNAGAATLAWQIGGTTFTGLTAGTDYFVYARSAQNTNYESGTPQVSSAIRFHIVTFDANGATSGTSPAAQAALLGGVITLPHRGNLERTDFTFGSWNTLANGTGTNYAPGHTLTVSANTTLFARWLPPQNFILQYEPPSTGTPPIVPSGITLSQTGVTHPTTGTITIANSNVYSSITWNYGSIVLGTGATLTLDAKDIRYNVPGTHNITIVLWENGVPFSRRVSFVIVP